LGVKREEEWWGRLYLDLNGMLEKILEVHE
jgi:hypothetical protein